MLSFLFTVFLLFLLAPIVLGMTCFLIAFFFGSKKIPYNKKFKQAEKPENNYPFYRTEEDEDISYQYGGGYTAYLRSPEWQVIKKFVLNRDHHTCQNVDCKARTKLEVHHESYKYIYHEMDNNCEDLVTLCRDCHQEDHDRKAKGLPQIVYGNFLRNFRSGKSS